MFSIATNVLLTDSHNAFDTVLTLFTLLGIILEVFFTKNAQLTVNGSGLRDYFDRG